MSRPVGTVALAAARILNTVTIHEKLVHCTQLIPSSSCRMVEACSWGLPGGWVDGVNLGLGPRGWFLCCRIICHSVTFAKCLSLIVVAYECIYVSCVTRIVEKKQVTLDLGTRRGRGYILDHIF